jgi:hypothetical protein
MSATCSSVVRGPSSARAPSQRLVKTTDLCVFQSSSQTTASRSPRSSSRRPTSRSRSRRPEPRFVLRLGCDPSASVAEERTPPVAGLGHVQHEARAQRRASARHCWSVRAPVCCWLPARQPADVRSTLLQMAPTSSSSPTPATTSASLLATSHQTSPESATRTSTARGRSPKSRRPSSRSSAPSSRASLATTATCLRRCSTMSAAATTTSYRVRPLIVPIDHHVALTAAPLLDR